MSQQMSSALAQVDQTPIILVGADSNEVRITSVELVEMINTFRKEEGNTVEKEHSDLLKSIRNEVETLEKAGIKGRGNFSPTSYIDNWNREKPCYSMNKAGALQMLNKESAVVRYKTVQYIEKLEKEKSSQQIDASQLSPELQVLTGLIQSMAKAEIRQKEFESGLVSAKEDLKVVSQKVDAIKEVVALDTTSWREDTTNLVNKIATYRGGTHNIYQETRREAYELLDKRFGVNLEQRLRNKRLRMADEGVSKSKRDKVSKLDVIADDKKLIEGYVVVIKDMALRYGVVANETT